MFDHDARLTPRTYSIKSYKKREVPKAKKAFMYLMYVIVLVAILGFSFLTMAHVI